MATPRSRQQGEGTYRILVALLTALTLGCGSREPAQPAASAPAPCERFLGDEPDPGALANCLLDTCRPLPEAGRARLRELAAAHPDDPWWQLAWGHAAPKRAIRTASLRSALSGFANAALIEPHQRTAARLSLELLNTNRHEEAAAVLDSAEELIEQAQNPGPATEIAIQRASLEVSRADDLGAAVRRLLALEPAVRAGPCSLRSNWLWTLGEAYYEQGDFRASRQYRSELLRLLRAAGDRREADAQYNLAILSFFEFPRPGAREEYIQELREVLRLAKTAGRLSAQARATLNLGRLLGGEEGWGFLNECRRLAVDRSNRCELKRCLEAMARHRLADSPRDAAALLASARKAQCDDIWRPLYSWPAELEVSWGTLPRDSAIAHFETVLEDMDEVLFQQRSEESRVGMFSRWSDAHQRFAGYLAREVDSEGSRDYLEHAFELSERMRARVLLDTVRPTVEGDVPRPRPQVRSLLEIEASLAPDEALLSYLLGEQRGIYGEFTGGSWLFVVTAGGTRVVPMPSRYALQQRVNLVNGLFADRDGESESVARQLHTDVLSPALTELPKTVDRIIVVPDGPLHSLPFAAVAWSHHPGTRLSFTQAPSATLWHHWRQAASTSARQVLVLADPEEPVEALERAGLPARLRFAKQEARAIRKHLADTEILSGSQATESFLKSEDLSSFGVIHLAAHAVVDPRRPERSAVLLTDDPEEDGSLTAGEIANLSLADKLVVLSACSGASGSTPKGEGVMSLARAFFKAGAPTVVASLWRLRDDEAAEIFDAFYRHLATGASVAEALDAAREELIQAGQPVAGWGAVIALGNGDLTPFR